MTDVSPVIRQLLDGVAGELEENGVVDFIIIMSCEDKNVISTKMTPQKTLLWLIDSLQTTKEQCLRQTQQSSEKHNN